MDTLEIYLNEVERQVDKKVRVVGLIEMVSIIKHTMKLGNT